MRFGLVSLFLFSLTTTATAADSAIQWLERMSHAVHNLNYAGTFVYMQGGQLETMRLVHAVDDGGERERLLSLSGPSREVIRQHGQVTCYLPEKEALVADHPEVPPGFPLNLPTQWAQLRNVYDFKLQERSRIAGQPVQQIAIVPHDKLRYGQNYWVAIDNGLPLRTDIVDATGGVLEQLEFTSLEVMHQIPEAMLQPESGGRPMELGPGTKGSVEGQQPMHWQVGQLPAGFELEMQRRHAINSDGVEVEHLIFSDGLTSVSVFIEPRRENAGVVQGSSRRGSVNAYTRLLSKQKVTVLGEVPLDTVMQIAESLAPLVH